MTDDARQFAPAAARNREPILEILRRVLPARGLVLELSSGTGEHATFFAPHFPDLVWQPSDPDPGARASIAAWSAATAAKNIRPPLDIDARDAVWPLDRADALVCINMMHIAPWTAALGLLAGARRLLNPGAPLFLYGPFKRDGQHTAPSNETFDASLRSRDPDWGVRDLASVTDAAGQAGLALSEVISMPANNLSVIFRVLKYHS